MENLNSALSSALAGDEIDYDEITDLLRKLRQSAGNSITFSTQFLDNLVAFADAMCRKADPRGTVAFRIAVQCMVNIMTASISEREYFAEYHASTIAEWMRMSGDEKSLNYTSAALLNIDKAGGLKKILESPQFVESLVNAGANGVEFAILLLQNLIETRNFANLYSLTSEKRIFLLQLLLACVGKCSSVLSEEIRFVADRFKSICDNIMSDIPSVSEEVTSELAVLLEILSTTSCKTGYDVILREDAPLVVNSSFLLRGIHECIKQKSARESMLEAFDCAAGDGEIRSRPFFGVRGDLVQLLGNLAYEHRKNQDTIRESGVIPIILDSCKLDGENPFIKEKAILAIRNLCDKNRQNQTAIGSLELKGTDVRVLHELGIKLADSEINIAPVQKR